MKRPTCQFCSRRIWPWQKFLLLRDGSPYHVHNRNKFREISQQFDELRDPPLPPRDTIFPSGKTAVSSISFDARNVVVPVGEIWNLRGVVPKPPKKKEIEVAEWPTGVRRRIVLE